MKSLNHYTDGPISIALKDNGAFYAFSNVQLEEQRQPDVTYVRAPGGLIVPKDNVDSLFTQMDNAIKAGIAARLFDHKIDDIIAYELGNYECYYTGDIQDAVDALQAYDVTYEQVHEVFKTTQNERDTSDVY